MILNSSLKNSSGGRNRRELVRQPFRLDVPQEFFLPCHASVNASLNIRTTMTLRQKLPKSSKIPGRYRKLRATLSKPYQAIPRDFALAGNRWNGLRIHRNDKGSFFEGSYSVRTPKGMAFWRYETNQMSRILFATSFIRYAFEIDPFRRPLEGLL